ncbi:membrane protein [hydrothermal vent metagenome]|uniref:Membrane protein n=1 Tax=hydrothermal vent metagenome TaxID=652676 RepID=A0A3B1EA43_9ZZZZ
MEELIKDWGYIVLFLYSFGGGFLALGVAGVLSYTGDLNIYITLIVASSANFIGDQFLFLLARNNKMQAKNMMKKHKRKIALAHVMMKKYGSIVIFLQKYIYGIKTLIPLVMGLTKYDARKFIFFNILATICWTLIVGISAYLLGEIILSYIEQFKTYGIIFIVIILIILSYYFKKV